MNWTLVFNSLLVSGAATVGAVGGGFFAALWLAGLEARWRPAFFAAAAVALALPPFLVVNCWIELLGEHGLWRPWLPWNIYSLGGTVWVLVLLTWPVTFFLVAGAWRRAQSSQLEIDPRLRGTALLRWLLLPLARTSLIQGAILTLVLALNNFAVPAILQVKVFPAEIWVRFNTTFDYGAALALSWPLLAAPFLLVSCFRRREAAWSWRSDAPAARAMRRQLGAGWHRAGGAVALFLAVFSLGVPLWQLAGSAKTWRQFAPALAAGRADMAHSLGFAALTATAVIVFGLLTWRARLDWALWIPFFTPGVLLGIALIWIFNHPWLNFIYQSGLIVVLAYSIRYAALGWTTVARAVRAADRSLADAARLEGASFWQMLRHVYWPQISPQLAAAWYLTYLLCLWDVETLVLIVPPGGQTMALRIFNLLHYGHNPQVNALCLGLLALAVLPLFGWAAWAGVRAWRRRRPFPAAALTAVLLTSAGCSPHDGKVFPIQSKLFSAVQIIGARGTGVGELNKPRGVAVDANDNVYVVDMTARVQKFSPDGVYLLHWQMMQTDQGKPKGMCRDLNGHILVIEPHYSRVNVFSTEGKLVTQWGVKGTNAGQLGMPRAAAANSRGEIYVCEYGDSERVQKFTADGTKLPGGWGRLGDAPGEFNRAEGLAMDAQGRLYVADSCNQRIQIFSAEGKFLRAYGKAGSRAGEFSYPYDIQVDGAGRQYVCEFGNQRIQIFDAQNQPLEILGGPGAAPGQFSEPWSIALDSKGNLYVADALNHRVQKFLRKPPGA
ncbi:MAG: 6-bladed beta-propeller [Verrucomicrobiota bacterium]|jgi:ABC-type Fe3+ transport system permease subunit/DNA-binding beta-propeller fold protein YncE